MSRHSKWVSDTGHESWNEDMELQCQGTVNRSVTLDMCQETVSWSGTCNYKVKA